MTNCVEKYQLEKYTVESQWEDPDYEVNEEKINSCRGDWETMLNLITPLQAVTQSLSPGTKVLFSNFVPNIDNAFLWIWLHGVMLWISPFFVMLIVKCGTYKHKLHLYSQF